MYADVLGTEFNTSVVEGKCELLMSFFLLVGRFGVSSMCRYIHICVCVCMIYGVCACMRM